MAAQRKFEKLLSEPNVDLEALKELSWKGCPPRFRGVVWQLLLGYLPSNTARRKARPSGRLELSHELGGRVLAPRLAGCVDVTHCRLPCRTRSHASGSSTRLSSRSTMTCQTRSAAVCWRVCGGARRDLAPFTFSHRTPLASVRDHPPTKFSHCRTLCAQQRSEHDQEMLRQVLVDVPRT